MIKFYVFVFICIVASLQCFGMSKEERMSAEQYIDSIINKDYNKRHVYGWEYGVSSLPGLCIRGAILWIRSELNDNRDVVAIDEGPHFYYIVSPDNNEEYRKKEIACTNKIIDEAKFTYYSFDRDSVAEKLLMQDKIVIQYEVYNVSMSDVQVVLRILRPSNERDKDETGLFMEFRFNWGIKIDNSNIYFISDNDVIDVLTGSELSDKLPQCDYEPEILWYLEDVKVDDL